MTLLTTRSEPKELRPRAAGAGVLAALAFLMLIGRLYYLQILHGKDLTRQSRQNFIKEVVEPAYRGFIYDRRGRVLADNRPSFDVYLTPVFCKNPDDVLARLQVLLQLDAERVEEVRKHIAKVMGVRRGAKALERERPYLVKLDVTRDELDLVQAYLTELECVDVEASPHRRYYDGQLFAHVVGYMSEVSPKELERSKGKYRQGDFIGRRGLERVLEDDLRGRDGLRRTATDAKGHELDSDTQAALIPKEEALEPAKKGNDVVLTIDLGLQWIADAAMREGARAGAVVVMDVHTGYVLAMVSTPSYDPNRMTGRISAKDLKDLENDPLQPLYQRAIQQHYSPGSTFKVVTALAALDKGIVGPENTTSCGGGYSLGSRRWRCWNDRGHGAGINLRRSLQQSCDTYYYWLADRMGLDAIAEKAGQLGFGIRTGIELVPETKGNIPNVAYHQRVDKMYTAGFALNAAIGQGSVIVTPLQLARAYASIANGGTTYRPRLVVRVQDDAGAVVRENPPEVVSTLSVKPAHLAAIVDGLTSVVNEPGGTAFSKRLAHIRVAGKTGTAQNVAIGKEREKKEDMPWEERDHAWFAAFAPAEAPEIAIAVINEHGGHGGAAAAPIAMAVIQGYFDLKEKEAALGRPLTRDEIQQLVPNAQYATQAFAMREKRARIIVQDMPAPPLPPDEPAAPADAVADPSLVRDPRRGEAPESTDPRAGEEARPSPE